MHGRETHGTVRLPVTSCLLFVNRDLFPRIISNKTESRQRQRGEAAGRVCQPFLRATAPHESRHATEPKGLHCQSPIVNMRCHNCPEGSTNASRHRMKEDLHQPGQHRPSGQAPAAPCAQYAWRWTTHHPARQPQMPHTPCHRQSPKSGQAAGRSCPVWLQSYCHR